MYRLPPVIIEDGALREAAIILLLACSETDEHRLRRVRIRQARNNWLRAPWYAYERGGAITVGQRIWFTRKWFAADGFGDGSIASTWKWLQHLAHEVGHLPQAERYGLNFLGKSRYVAAFIGQYAWRVLRLKKDAHDGAPLEIEADMGRWVLRQLVGDDPLKHPLVLAVHANDADAVRLYVKANGARLEALKQEYRQNHGIDN